MSCPKLVYLAGPFSGKTRADVEANIRRVEELGIEVCKLGALPIMPHTNSNHADFESLQPYDFWIEGYKELLRRCDAVLFTPDWSRSSGARGEHTVAELDAVPRFFDLRTLAGWIHQESLSRLGINWAQVH